MLNVNNVSRKAVSFGVSKIPEAGEILSTLLEALWPEDEDSVWSQIKDQMESFVNQKLDTLVFDQVTGKLNDLRLVLHDYREAVADSTTNLSYITENFNVASGQFNAMQDDFKTPGHEFLLLPLFAQMVNLHLALLRDGALYGASWGWDPKIVVDITNRIERFSAADVAWAVQWYHTGIAGLAGVPENVSEDAHIGNMPLWNLLGPTKTAHRTSKQWNIDNTYRRQMALQVMDFAYYWPYFSPRKGLAPKMTREIYSDVQGTADFHRQIEPDSTTHDRLSWVNIWAWDWPYGIQTSDRPEWNPLSPSEASPTAGSASGALGPPPHGCSEPVTVSNPVVEVHGRSGDLVNSVGLSFRDGTKVDCGGYAGGTPFSWSFDGHVLSQIYSTGAGHANILESMVFGFRLEDSYDEIRPSDATAIAARMHSADYLIAWGQADESQATGGGALAWGYDAVDNRPALTFNGRTIMHWNVLGDDSLSWTDQPAGDSRQPTPFAAELSFFCGDGSPLPGDQISGWLQMVESGERYPTSGRIPRDNTLASDPREG